MSKAVVAAEIVEQNVLSEQIFELLLAAREIAQEGCPGQFVHILLPMGSHILRRPVGIAGRDEAKQTIRVIYRAVGSGTKALSKCKAGDSLSVLGPLGSGFSTEFSRPLLIGGGIGLSPLLFLAKVYCGKADLLMGGKNETEVFWKDLFANDCKKIFVTTDDGSVGTKGFPTSLLPEILSAGDYDGVLACGPDRMMEHIAKISAAAKIPCQVSLEKRMACGLGACLSCSVKTTQGRRKVCKDGPVFWANEVYDA